MMDAASDPPNPPALPSRGPVVLLTRRRWDWYFLPATLGAVLLAGLVAYWTGDLRRLWVPVPLALLWGLVRAGTPPDGMPSRRLAADADMLPLLWWGGLMLLVLLSVQVADCFVTGRAFGAPYESYHLALIGPILVIFLVGTLILARRIDRRRKQERSALA